MGRRAFHSGGDLADPAVVARVFRECKAAFGGLDCFVANAGIWPVEEIPLGRLSEERWRSTLAQNLDAVFLTTRAALGLMGTAMLAVFALLALLTEAAYRQLGAVELRWLAVGVFVLAWIGQFVGHRSDTDHLGPSFLTDLSYLLIGPAWLIEKLLRKLGFKAST